MLGKDILYGQIISRRTFLLLFCKIFLFGILLVRIFFLQFLRNKDYEVLSAKNRTALLTVPPLRGKILDRNNSIIADNRLSFNVFIHKKSLTSLENLYELLNLNHDTRNAIENKVAKSVGKKNIEIISDIPWETVAMIEEDGHKVPGVSIQSQYTRNYQYSEYIPHIIGYVGAVNETEKKLLSLPNVDKFSIGKSGIEKQYDQFLRGDFGYKYMEVDAYGTYIREVNSQLSIPGQSLKLSIDLKLQEVIVNILKNTTSVYNDSVYDRGCSVSVMDIETGKILAMVSGPAYDLQQFTGKISPQYWKQLNSDIYHPLINKVITTQYPPGSVFKIITSLAGLEHGMDPHHRVHCSGGISIGDKTFLCWKHSGHGSLNMFDAIKHSCNCYMYHIAKVIGAENILRMATKLGLGARTGIDLPYEAAGFVPDRMWKIKKFKFDWSYGDACNIAIGQGALLTTPIQLLRMTAAIASNGKLYTPSMREDSDPIFTTPDIKLEHIGVIQEGMRRVMQEPGGTGYASRLWQVTCAGKSGTAQVRMKHHKGDDLSASTVEWERRNHALFTSYMPFDNPKYAIFVLVDHGGAGGRAAAPITKSILEYLSSLRA